MSSTSPDSDSLLAGVTEDGAATDLFWKKPAMLCCFCAGFWLLETVDFFVEARCVPTSLPSIPRAIVDVRNAGKQQQTFPPNNQEN